MILRGQSIIDGKDNDGKDNDGKDNDGGNNSSCACHLGSSFFLTLFTSFLFTIVSYPSYLVYVLSCYTISHRVFSKRWLPMSFITYLK